MNKTNVPYATHALHAVRGCTSASEACHGAEGGGCYARRLCATRLCKVPAYAGLAEMRNGRPQWTGEVRLCPEELQKPLRRRSPAVVFVADMGDMFHEKVPFEYIAALFGVMAATSHITYILLTKRAKRLREFYEWVQREAAAAVVWNGGKIGAGGKPLAHFCATMALEQVRAQMTNFQFSAACNQPWPLPNVWTGVSVESQDYVWRVEELLKVPAVGHWVSVEPMLSAVQMADLCNAYLLDDPAVDGIVCGCESGPGRRPFELDWARSLRDQCAEAGVPFYLKQMPGDGGVVAEPHLDGRQHLELPWQIST
jgi:protein gp37